MLTQSIIPGAVRPDLLRDETLADIFRATAARVPQKAALIFNGEVLTYAQLDAWSDAIAAFLNEKGITAGSHVGIWWPRGLALHAAILGIVKSGAAYVPLDREMPTDRVLTVMEEVGADALIADIAIAAPCPVYEVPEFGIRNSEFGMEMPETENSLRIPNSEFRLSPDNNAYVLYTSGSTGKPKGIPITHRNICHLVAGGASGNRHPRG